MTDNNTNFYLREGVLLLTNNENAYELYEWLKSRENRVYLYSEAVCAEQIKNMNPDIIISYNYNYIISSDVIELMNGNIINMHISYLPWNRGFSPNLWSFIDDTPKGVTIHYIDEELDKGRIIAQKELFFDISAETFNTTYNKLNYEIKQLFYENWEYIKSKKVTAFNHNFLGTYHSMNDLKALQSKLDFSWNDNIKEFLIRYRKIQKKE